MIYLHYPYLVVQNSAFLQMIYFYSSPNYDLFQEDIDKLFMWLTGKSLSLILMLINAKLCLFVSAGSSASLLPRAPLTLNKNDIKSGRVF